MPRHRVATGTLVGLLLVVAPRGARAEDDDGAYERLDGDTLLVGEAGAAVAEGGPSLLVGARALYLSTAGGYVRYVEGFGDDGLATARSFGVGVELRPLFLARFARDWERGPAHLDLLLDSFALDVGAFFWAPPGGSVRSIPGLEVATGLEVPVLPRGSGPRLGVMGSLRVSHGDTGAPGEEDLDARASAILVTLSWHQIVDLGIVDAGDALVH
jgi:hypothetical protein